MRKTITTLVTIAIMAVTARAAIITHTSADDAFLHEGQSGTNQEGSNRNLYGGQSWGVQFVVLMKFSLADVYTELGASGGTITSVRLDLGPAMTSGSGAVSEFTGDLYQYTDFDAATTTWMKPDGSIGLDTTPGGSYSAETLLAQQTFGLANIAPATHVFLSTTAMVNYLQAAYDNGDNEVYFRLSNDSFNTPNSFLRTDAGDVRGTGQASLIVIPEPATLSMLVVFGGAVLLFRRRTA